MAYVNKQKYNNRNTNKSNDKQNDNENFPIINHPLSEVYNNPEDLYLPQGLANKYAKKFNNCKTHQMRKILNIVKEAKLLADSGDLSTARRKMFMIVAMTAYNAGRNRNLNSLYMFVKNTINEKSIVSEKDIEAFDQFYTSVIAYHTEGK